MPKPNYNFEKRQREIAKKKQQDEKLAKKRAKNAPSNPPAGEPQDNTADETPTASSS